jgi:Carboxyl transferase domain
MAAHALEMHLPAASDLLSLNISASMVLLHVQVWYPDSAAKTADAIEEFAREGLPLLVLANWRGFSGGQRDLLEGVLQCGSRIVNCLRSYTQPVIVYVPPGCELRGGAWVVVDSQINSDQMEMFAGAHLLNHLGTGCMRLEVLNLDGGCVFHPSGF